MAFTQALPVSSHAFSAARALSFSLNLLSIRSSASTAAISFSATATLYSLFVISARLCSFDLCIRSKSCSIASTVAVYVADCPRSCSHCAVASRLQAISGSKRLISSSTIVSHSSSAQLRPRSSSRMYSLCPKRMTSPLRSLRMYRLKRKGCLPG